MVMRELIVIAVGWTGSLIAIKKAAVGIGNCINGIMVYSVVVEMGPICTAVARKYSSGNNSKFIISNFIIQAAGAACESNGAVISAGQDIYKSISLKYRIGYICKRNRSGTFGLQTLKIWIWNSNIQSRILY